MGNAQKKLNRKRGKDAKKGRAGQEDKTIAVESQEGLQDLLSKGPIENFYDVNTNMLLGRGHYAVVNLATCKRTGRQVAVKRIQISKSRVEALQREVYVLKKIGDHPNIVNLYDIFITSTELQLVLELLKGGELFDRMVEKGPYSEREASHHIRKIGLALKYLHRHGIVHRDLKPENLILVDKTNDSELKIADFGLSKIVDDVASSTMQTVCGTWAYCAPEVKTSVLPHDSHNSGGSRSVACYTAAVDLWSVGVILFVILGAYHPFDPDGDASDGELWDKICTGEFDFEDPAWETISDLAKDLIRKLIVVDPAKRFTADQLLEHPWVKLSASVPATPITPGIDKSLGGFVTKKKAMTPRIGFNNNFNVNQMNNLNQPNPVAQVNNQFNHQEHQQNYMNQMNQQNYMAFQQQQQQQQQMNQQQYGVHNQVHMFGNPTTQQPSQPAFGGNPASPQVQFNTSLNVTHMAQKQNGNGFGTQQNPGITLDTFVNKEPEVMDLVTPTAGPN